LGARVTGSEQPACSLVYRKSAGTAPGQPPENAERPTSNLAYALGARLSMLPGESDEVLAKDNLKSL
jgi:hypothetical protein